MGGRHCRALSTQWRQRTTARVLAHPTRQLSGHRGTCEVEERDEGPQWSPRTHSPPLWEQTVTACCPEKASPSLHLIWGRSVRTAGIEGPHPGQRRARHRLSRLLVPGDRARDEYTCSSTS